MPWFLIVLSLVVGLSFWGIRKKKETKYDWERRNTCQVIFGIMAPILFFTIIGGYIFEHNGFIYMHNNIEAWESKIIVLENQEKFVLGEISVEASRFLNHEEKVYKELKITSNNLSAVLTMYPQLRSSAVIVKYIGNIRQLREQITKAKENLYSEIASYNGATRAAFRRHFRPGYLPVHLEYR